MEYSFASNLHCVLYGSAPYRTPPPGWTPGDRPSQDPLCAKELRLLSEDYKKLQEELTNISDSIMEMKDQIGTLSSMVGHTSNRTDCFAEKVRNQAALERRQALAVVKESVSTGEKTAAEAKAAKLQKLNSGFRIWKAQGTLLWPNMAPNNGSSPFVVQVHTTPSTTSAPPQLPYHHHRPPTYTIRPVPERALTLTIKTAPGSKSINFMNLSNTPDTYAAFTTARHVSIAFRTVTSKRHVSIGSSRWSNVMASVLNAWQSNLFHLVLAKYCWTSNAYCCCSYDLWLNVATFNLHTGTFTALSPRRSNVEPLFPLGSVVLVLGLILYNYPTCRETSILCENLRNIMLIFLKLIQSFAVIRCFMHLQ